MPWPSMLNNIYWWVPKREWTKWFERGVSSICNSLHIELHLICSIWLLYLVMPCTIKPDMHHICLCIMSWLCCGVYRVICLFLDCFFSIEFRKRFGVWGFVWLCLVRLHSQSHSSKQDLRQDEHFPGYHYYHCHVSCLVSIVMSLYLSLVCQTSQSAMISL